ncbi:aldose 1-epimerase family protein [Rhodococcus opacus]|uniref:aldose 1-epimerase family protein n=1 Tax=Rhodococcus opacus TaxID=37919 RepID=UPI001C483D51|nr:aldose 1-epimerase family protein [Rhodococcus opacus]MBV6760397.1 aldose 1-epimerase family protein [Rhodococcus opacus]
MSAATTTTRPRSGTQYTISGFGYTAQIASIGASLREIQYDGRDLIVSFPADTVRPNYRGATIAPWPNRVVDGTYRFNDLDHQLAITEPTRGHALHGLACWLDYHCHRQSDTSVTLQTLIEPQAGYPWRLHLQVTFTCTPRGVHTSVTAANLGADPAPFGAAPHPYLVAGPSPMDDWTLHLPADQIMTVTPDRLIPTGIGPVETTENGRYDFRAPRPLGATTIDHAFTGLHRDTTGRTAVILTDPTGLGVRMTWGQDCRWVQIHTADLPAPAPTRLGLAVEPMTCPPDAFNTQRDLVILRPGAVTTTEWQIDEVTEASAAV